MGGASRKARSGGRGHEWIYGDGEWHCLVCLARRTQEDRPEGGKACPGVNPSLVGGISTLLKELNQTRKGSFVVIEHNMDFVMDLCHRIMVMVEGQVMAIGTPEEIYQRTQLTALTCG